MFDNVGSSSQEARAGKRQNYAYNTLSKSKMLINGAPGLSPKGTFWLFSAVPLLGLGFVWFFLPETAGKSLEGMNEMFSLPRHIIGRKGAELTKGKGSVSEARMLGENEKGVDIEGAEVVEDVNLAAKRY
jgi:hypothetical protein